eukprot:m.1572036 g.1572036  ORF g.1572036 m.1572036 type:complete len:73 (+) comp25302_c0_seq8:7508-7726(+)
MPYYATHVDEVAFHVSTFLECSTGGARLGPGDDDVRSIASLSRTNSGDSDGTYVRGCVYCCRVCVIWVCACV